MKNLILYGTTYGCTEFCANELKKKLNAPTDCVNVSQAAGVELNAYDTIILGSPVYMGQMDKHLKAWVNEHEQALQSKRVAFFVCCGFPEMAQKHLEANMPKSLLNKAIAAECFGGKMDISKMKFLHRLITKMVAKAAEEEGKQQPQMILENIDKLARAING
jgi:menaquinone-dependent protoporphyrinogen oxidase